MKEEGEKCGVNALGLHCFLCQVCMYCVMFSTCIHVHEESLGNIFREL